jgi:hypothetical protein
MGRGVIVLAIALLCALASVPAASEAAPERLPRATTATDGTVLIAGVPRFLIGAGWPTPAVVPEALTLGIGILQGNGPGATQLSISEAVGSKGFVVPDYSLKHLHAHYRNAIGYSLPDEADGNGLLPAGVDPDLGTRLPVTARAQKTGVLIMQTLTSHFMPTRPKWEGIGDAEYRAYIANADVVLTAVYPFAHGCADPGLSLSMVYDAMVELKKLAPSKAVGEWIETGPIEGYCGADPVSPEVARAEAWASVAGGGQSLFWFTHTFTKGYWDDFDISPEMATAIAATNAELLRYTKIILAHRMKNVVSAPGDPVKVGLRFFRGRLYLVAANLSAAPVDLLQDEGQPRLPGLDYQTVDELTTGRVGQAWAGRIADTVPAWGVRIYGWWPNQAASARGSSNEKLDPAPS